MLTIYINIFPPMNHELVSYSSLRGILFFYSLSSDIVVNFLLKFYITFLSIINCLLLLLL